jgi:hypothetical protein
MSLKNNEKDCAIKKIVKGAMHYKNFRTEKMQAKYKLHYLEQRKIKYKQIYNFHKNEYSGYKNKAEINNKELEIKRIAYYTSKKKYLEINYKINELVTKYDIKEYTLTLQEKDELNKIYEPIRKQEQFNEHRKSLHR